MIFESHAHYNDSRYKKDLDEVLNSLAEVNVTKVINVAYDVDSSRKSIELAKKYDFILATVGVHPSDVNKMCDEDINILRELYKCEEKVVAVGEIGLDYHYENIDIPKQKYFFKKQLELALELNAPVIIHSRESDQDVFDILKSSGHNRGVIHCFSGSLEMAKEYIKLGFYIGVGGVVTFDNAKKLQNIVKEIPLESILIETDCPYLTPAPFRGERNDSTKLVYIVEKIAELKNIDKSVVEEITFNNALSLFKR